MTDIDVVKALTAMETIIRRGDAYGFTRSIVNVLDEYIKKGGAKTNLNGFIDVMLTYYKNLMLEDYIEMK